MARKQSPAQLKNLDKGKATQFTSENASENGKKGHKASVIARKRNKARAEFATVIADGTVTNDEMKKTLTDLGITDEDARNDYLVAAGIFNEAIKSTSTICPPVPDGR